MTDRFDSRTIDYLREKYPNVDLEAEMAQVSDGARNPDAVLTSRVKAAADRPAPVPKAPKAPAHAGYFTLEGRWIDTGDENDYWQAPGGSITRGVRQLVYLRRERGLTPRQAAMLVEAHRLGPAFPSREQWLDVLTESVDGRVFSPDEQWIEAIASTGAEAAVKHSGQGTQVEHDHSGGGVKRESVTELVSQMAEKHGWRTPPDPIDHPAPSGGKAHDPSCTCEICFAKIDPRFYGG